MSNARLFEIVFIDELFELILNQTSNYALFENCPDPQITVQKLGVFIAILLVSDIINFSQSAVIERFPKI